MTQTPENQQQYGSILTILGENAEQNGKLQNKQITFTHMAIGDANDEYVQPDRKQTSLVNELARIPVNSVDVLQPTPDSVPMLKVEAILPDDVNDLVIREFAAVATFDGNTYFHAVGNNARIYVPPPVNNGNVNTPVTLEMIFVITSADPIVEMDPHVVTASREYVNKEIAKRTDLIFSTIQEMQDFTGDILDGMHVRIIDRDNAMFLVVPKDSPNGYDLIDTNHGNMIQLIDIYSSKKLGLSRTSDNIDAFNALSTKDIFFNEGIYKTSGKHTFTGKLIFDRGAHLEATKDIVSINGIVDAIDYPFKKSGTGRIDVNAVDLIVPDDYPTVQSAIDAVPSVQWQRFNISIKNGTYDEEVYINNKWAGSATTGLVAGERTGVYIIGETKEGVKVKAYMVTSSGGACFTPMIANQQVIGHNSKTNEKCSIEFYGCPSGAVLGVDFRSTQSSDKALMSYGSVISAEEVDFGDQLYNDLFVVKHGGKIMSNSNTRLGIGKSPIGRAKRYAINPIGGEVLLADSSGLTANSFDAVRRGGAMAGFVYDTASQAFYGPKLLVDHISSYQTYFTSLDGFTKGEHLTDSSVTIEENHGLNLHCGSVANAHAQAFLRREHVIGTQNILFQQQLMAAVHFSDMSGAFFELGIGYGNGRTYIEVNPSKVRGIFVDGTGSSSYVEICDTSDIVGDKCVFNIFIERNNTTESTQMANVRFKVSTTTFEQYKDVKAISGSLTNVYQWFAKLQSIDGTQQDVNIGELRLYRS
ncbi:phage tail protein [Vibrio furnissii]|uniref:phage tail-collar fiber domain-containing protein n=1 Tax=Vibrio furnissii TaxID=29494 RepID=UPI00155973B6|nr:phage tail protein [Vibrio furnissii]